MVDISVIIPVYNVEQYLNRCLDSIVNQTKKNIEIILINDGSTDKSKEICEKYLYHDKRITLINQENKGVSASRNIGIDLAQGKYIMFIDSDDFVNINMFNELYSIAETTSADIVSCKYSRVNEKEIYINRIQDININANQTIYNSKEALKEYLSSKNENEKKSIP